MGFREEMLSNLQEMTMEELRGLWELVERVQARRMFRENREAQPRKKDEMIRSLETKLRNLSVKDWEVLENLFHRVQLLDLLEETWRELEASKGQGVTFREIIQTARQKIQHIPHMRQTLRQMSGEELHEAIKAFTRVRLLKALESSLEEV